MALSYTAPVRYYASGDRDTACGGNLELPKLLVQNIHHRQCCLVKILILGSAFSGQNCHFSLAMLKYYFCLLQALKQTIDRLYGVILYLNNV